MRIFSLIIIANLIIAHEALSQSYIKYAIGASVSGSLSQCMQSGSTTSTTNGVQSWERYLDSTSSNNGTQKSLGINIWGQMLFGRKWILQGGLGYFQTGFTRVQDNIQYLDLLYPGIGQGKLMEKSGGSGTKSILYDYQFRYIQIPMLIHYEVFHSRDYTIRTYLTAGVTPGILIQHHINATLINFVVEGKDSYSIDSSGYNARSITLSTQLGAKVEYKYDKKTLLYAMPIIGINPISITSGSADIYPYYLQLQLGVTYAWGKTEEKK